MLDLTKWPSVILTNMAGEIKLYKKKFAIIEVLKSIDRTCWGGRINPV